MDERNHVDWRHFNFLWVLANTGSGAGRQTIAELGLSGTNFGDPLCGCVCRNRDRVAVTPLVSSAKQCFSAIFPLSASPQFEGLAPFRPR